MQQLLYQFAQAYDERGWSVIPVHGSWSRSKPKVAAIPWAIYQRQRPSAATIRDWFEHPHPYWDGIAVVCGRVSRLAVLDFDDAKLAASFADALPHLTETLLVRSGTRDLPHYYYTIGDDIRTHSRVLKRADWQFNGRYVVAAPTTIGSGSWRVCNKLEVRVLTQADVDAIMRFFGLPDVLAARHVQQLPRRISAFDLEPNVLAARYRGVIARGKGRNQALFDTACWLRDQGATPDDAVPLIRYHIEEPTYKSHHARETPLQRQMEAERTIASAFSRQGRAAALAGDQRVPNALREELLRRGLMSVLRVLEALFHAKVKPGTCINRKDVLARCAVVGVGDWSVRQALAACLPDGCRVFQEVTSQSERIAKAAFPADAVASSLYAIERTVTSPTQNRRGRPNHVYHVPSPAWLCGQLGLKLSPSDQVPCESLAKSVTYRMALHESFLSRRPGQYKVVELAHRLGVHTRTIRRYHRTSSCVQVQSMYLDVPIRWDSAPVLLDGLPMFPGVFLEDSSGKRYPPMLGIALRLLGRKRQLILRRRLPNYYFTERVSIHHGTGAVRDGYDAALRYLPRTAFTVSAPSTDASCNNLTAQCDDPAVLSTAQELYDFVARNGGGLSMKRALVLASRYEHHAIISAIDVAKRHDRVRHMAGFLTSVLQGFSTSVHQNAIFLKQRVEGICPEAGLSLLTAQRLLALYNDAVVDAALARLQERVADGGVRSPVGLFTRLLAREQERRPISDCDISYDAKLAEELVVFTRRNKVDGLSANFAVSLIQEFGTRKVKFFLALLKKRQGVYNAAGYLITMLRGDKKYNKRTYYSYQQ